MDGRACPSCGTSTEPDWRFCEFCGAPRDVVDANMAPPAEEVPATQASFPAPPWRWISVQRDVDRTRHGLVILAVASLVALIPFCGPSLYVLLGLVGALLIFTARHSFDPPHRSNVVSAIVAWVVGFVVGVVGIAIALVILLSSAQQGSAALHAAVAPASGLILFTTFVTTALIGLAWVVLPYGLTTTDGRVFLWAAFGINLFVGAALVVLFREEFVSTFTRAIAGGNAAGFDPLGGSMAELWGFSAVSAALYTVGYLMAFARLGRGDASQLASGHASPPD